MIRNESMETLRFDVGLELGSDFADIFAVKEHDFTLGDPENAKPLPPPAPADWESDGSLCFADGNDRTQVLFSLAGPPERLGRDAGRSSSRAASSGSSWSRCCSKVRAGRNEPAACSATSSRTCATRSPRGTCACRR